MLESLASHESRDELKIQRTDFWSHEAITQLTRNNERRHLRNADGRTKASPVQRPNILRYTSPEHISSSHMNNDMLLAKPFENGLRAMRHFMPWKNSIWCVTATPSSVIYSALNVKQIRLKLAFLERQRSHGISRLPCCTKLFDEEIN